MKIIFSPAKVYSILRILLLRYVYIILYYILYIIYYILYYIRLFPKYTAFNMKGDIEGITRLAIFSVILETANPSVNWLLYSARITFFREELKYTLKSFCSRLDKLIQCRLWALFTFFLLNPTFSFISVNIS